MLQAWHKACVRACHRRGTTTFIYTTRSSQTTSLYKQVDRRWRWSCERPWTGKRSSSAITIDFAGKAPIFRVRFCCIARSWENILMPIFTWQSVKMISFLYHYKEHPLQTKFTMSKKKHLEFEPRETMRVACVRVLYVCFETQTHPPFLQERKALHTKG